MTAREFAAALAREIGGAVRELSDDELAVVTVDGRVPALVRHGYAGFSVEVDGIHFNGTEADFDGARLATLRTAAFDYLAKRQDTLSMYAVAAGLIDGFAKQLGERWAAHIPGRDPYEISVRFGSDQIGIFPHGVGYGNPKPVKNRAELDKLVPSLVADIKRSRAVGAHYAKLYAQQDAAAAILVDQLAKGTALPTKIERRAYSERSQVVVELRCGERLVLLTLADGVARVRVGIAGRGELECPLADVEARMPEIRTALAAAHATLTVDDLKVGARYRVLAKVGELTPGDEIIYRGYDDIENHYGEHMFDRADGKRLIVGSSYSALSPAHQFLEAI